MARNGVQTVGTFYFRKNDDARAGLEEGLDLDFDLLADVRLAVVDDDHGAVGQIADTLSLVLAFAHDFQLQGFAGEQNHLEAFGDLMEIDVADLLQFGDLGQVVIVGVKPGIEVVREVDEFGVHFRVLRENRRRECGLPCACCAEGG